MQKSLIQYADMALRKCLDLQRNEALLVVCDDPCLDVGEAFFAAGQALCRETVMVKIVPRQTNGNEPPPPVGEWFGSYDVAVMPTSKSLTHTQARRAACEKGARIATLPGITGEVFLRTMQCDWDTLGRCTRMVASDLNAASVIEVTSDAGTRFTFETGGRHAKPDDGIITKKGTYGNLPAGEAYLSPFEGTAEGTIVFDGSFPLAGLLDEPLVLRVKKGKVTEVSGHPCARQLEKLFVKYHEPARNIAEFGVGTLETAIITGNVLEDEKVKGTIHVAVGDNSSMGGLVKVPIHLDGIVRKPTVRLDGKLWMEKGKLVQDGAPIRGQKRPSVNNPNQKDSRLR